MSSRGEGLKRQPPLKLMTMLMRLVDEYGWEDSDKQWFCGYEHWPSRSIGYSRVYRSLRLYEMWVRVKGVYSSNSEEIDKIKYALWDRTKRVYESWKGCGISSLVYPEGPHTGRKVIEVLSSQCNVACPTCNENVNEGVMMSSAMFRRAVGGVWHGEELMIVRQGEPLMWQENMAFLESLFDWRFNGREISIITHGMMYPNKLMREFVGRWVIEPKGEMDVWLNVKASWERLRPDYLIRGANDAGVSRICKLLLRDVEKDRIYVVPMGTTRDEVDKSESQLSGTKELGIKVIRNRDIDKE